MVSVFGIVNVTSDSFSDGGAYIDPNAAIAHGQQLVRDGAAVVDVGAESTHPDAEELAAEAEIERLRPVVTALLQQGLQVSVDTRKPDVMAAMAELSVHWLNDVSGFRSERAIAVAASCEAKLVVMFARQHDGRARRDGRGGDAVAEAMEFFSERVAALQRAGVRRERIVLDPGMGFFLSPDAETSFAMLRRLRELRTLGLPLLVSVSRKSFLAAATGRAPKERGAATLAAELFAARQGVDWIRTHDVRALCDGLLVQDELEPQRGFEGGCSPGFVL
ncbi:MAG: dihydropteroate synthase [Planctomycetota bacterium]